MNQCLVGYFDGVSLLLFVASGHQQTGICQALHQRAQAGVQFVEQQTAFGVVAAFIGRGNAHQARKDRAHPFLVGFSEAISGVFVLGAVVLAVALAIVWFLPEEKLRTQSGIAARHEQESAAAALREGPASD